MIQDSVNAFNSDAVSVGIDIFEDFLELRLKGVVSCLPSIVGFAFSLASCEQLDSSYRILGLSFIDSLIKLFVFIINTSFTLYLFV